MCVQVPREGVCHADFGTDCRGDLRFRDGGARIAPADAKNEQQQTNKRKSTLKSGCLPPPREGARKRAPLGGGDFGEEQLLTRLLIPERVGGLTVWRC